MDSSDFVELAQHLNQERLFVNSERLHLQALNEKVQKTVERLFHVTWIARQQRMNLDSMILSKGMDSTPSACCQRANLLEGVQFTDGYKLLGFQESQYGEFVQSLRGSPRLLAMCLAAGEKLGPDIVHHLVHILVDSVYGHCMLQEDEQLVLQLLKHLMEMQLASTENPLRRLRHGTCAFGRVYKVFNEGLFSAKLFLTGALHDSIMNLLMEDELFLDIDPSKAVVRFPLHERLSRFGIEGTPQYAASLQRYRNWTINKLVHLTNRFIAGIRENLYCFPSSLLWLVKQLYNSVMKAKKVEVREVGAMCADLVFAFFICPAIVNPEPYGICDAPISYIARFNLMQVAQILQVLAMSKWEEIDPKLMDLYGKFKKDCMSSVLDFLLEGGVDDVPVINGVQMQGLVRTAVLITENNLHSLIRFLRQVLNDSTEKWMDRHNLQSLLNILPPLPLPVLTTACGGLNSGSSLALPSVPTPPQTPGPRKSILGKVGMIRNRGSHGAMDGGGGDNNLFHQFHSVVQQQQQDVDDILIVSNSMEVEDVLVISLNVNMECPGMLPEHKVLSMVQQEKQVRMKVDMDDDDGGGGPAHQAGSGETLEKRTRFSLSHDQDSIGNTSDNLEAISELASNHSVSSSIELENENDNLSDMISANVSGRGTPNVSGRDTPSSQVEGEEIRDRRPLDLPVTAEKQNREDISEKFGKFEIKKVTEGDEAVSMVSDTWSTDVLASDSETVEQGERASTEYVGQAGCSNTSQAAAGAGNISAVLDSNETASEAWSIDVMASDSERLQDVDTDDTASVARSDDTASIARSDDVSRYADDAGLIDLSRDPLLRIDVPDHGDDNVTPHASGGRSPIDGPRSGINPDEMWLNTLHVATGFIPVELQSSKTGKAEGASSQLVIPVPRQMTELVREFGDLGVRVRGDAAVQGRRLAEGVKHSQGKVPSSSLTAFDPLNQRRNSHKTNNDTDKESSFSAVSDDAESMASDVMGMQSLGRLSFAMDDLSDNGIGSEDIPSLLDVTRNYAIANATRPVPSDIDVFPDIENGGIELMDVCGAWSSDIVPCDDDDDDDGCSSARLLFPDSPEKCAATTLDVLESNKSPEQNGGLMGFYPLLPASSMSGVNGELMSDGTDRDAAAAAVRLSSDSIASSSSSGVGSASGEVMAAAETVDETAPMTIYAQKSRETRAVMEAAMPTAASGAIPKSISFDVTAEKGDKESLDGDGFKGKRGFFRNLKLTLKRPGRKTGSRYQNGFDKGGREVNGKVKKDHEPEDTLQETGDDILAKYRKKQPSASSDISGASEQMDAPNDDRASDGGCGKRCMGPIPDDKPSVIKSGNKLEELYAFTDAKRKLRLVLSMADARATPWLEKSLLGRMVNGSGGGGGQGNELVAFLKIQLAEAINLQDKSLTAQLHEALRCVTTFDKVGCKKLLKSLAEDYKKRHPYIAYLIRCRQSLLSSLSHLERLLRRVERDKEVCNSCMIFVCVRLFLERRERNIQLFTEDFQKLTVSDEKTDLVEEFLQVLYKQLVDDPMWQGASQAQLEIAERAIERSIMSKIYIHALYPNGDGDFHRDQVLHEHIAKLSNVITPDHKDLRIPKIYHYECPWPSAQAEVITINAYKTPGDKLQCVVHCCTTIMNLLRMANEKSVPAADDFIPVLVYVVIKANPASLLSTIQYVNSFFHKQLKGEDEYWWTQFTSAVEFIKTMDYVE